MQKFRTLFTTIIGYLLTSAAIVAYYWMVGAHANAGLRTFAPILLCLAGAMCAWLCLAASTSRPSAVTWALGCGFTAATASFVIAAAMVQAPSFHAPRTPPLWCWSLPAGGVTLLALAAQGRSKLRLRSELGISILAAFAIGCAFSYGVQARLPELTLSGRLPLIAACVVCLVSGVWVLVRASADAFQLSWAGGATLLAFSLAAAYQAIHTGTDFNLTLTLIAVGILGMVPVVFCQEALRAIRAQAAQSGELDPATRDVLTGLYNRRALDTLGRELYRQALRADRPVSILMLDIDHFKQVNDTYGHAAGDAVLARFGAIISEHVRTSDFVARYGGEEFAAILPGAPLGPAMRLAERIRQAVEQLEVPYKELRIRVTTSIGAASEFPGESVDFRQLIDRADKNLYRAKRGGRNQVITDPLQDEST